MLRKILLISCFVTLIWGCAKKQIVKPQESIQTTPQIEAPETKDEASIRYTDWQAVQQLRSIQFDYDKSDLSQQAREILKANAEYLKNNQDYTVLVEGHCDERGTTEYNLALGQRRAAAVRKYYGQLGVPLGSIGTISYGEEMPLDSGHTESAWAKNRRAETKIRNK